MEMALESNTGPSATASEPSGAPSICLGLLGWISLHSGDYLMYVSERKKVGQLNGKDVFRIIKSTLLPTAVSFGHMTPAQVTSSFFVLFFVFCQ